MSPPGKRLVGRLSLARSTPHADRRHANQEHDEREPASDSSLPVSRETSPSPRETAAMPPTPVRQRTLSRSDLPYFSNRRHPICPAQSRRICHVHPRQQYVVSRRARHSKRETATRHRKAASRCSSRATAYALPASGKGEGITSHQQLEITASTIGDVCRVSRSIAVGRFTIGFT